MVFELAGLTIRNFITNVANSSQAKGLPSAVKTQHQKRLGVWPALQYFEFHIQSDLVRGILLLKFHLTQIQYTTRTNELVNMGAKPSAQLKRKQDALNAALKPAKRTCMEGVFPWFNIPLHCSIDVQLLHLSLSSQDLFLARELPLLALGLQLSWRR